MTLATYTSAAWVANGGVTPASDAMIEVRNESDGSLATIYSDREGTQAITNPSAFGDAFGRFAFFADDGEYRVKVSQDGNEYTLRYQSIGDVSRHASEEGGIHGIPEGQRALNSQELLSAVSEATDINEAVEFVGRGAIVESGTNANGSYVRWENGEQVCWRNITINITSTSAFENFNYPSSFTETAAGSCSGNHEEENWALFSDSIRDLANIAFISMRSYWRISTTTNNYSDDTVDFGLTLFAWGFWK